MHHSTQAWWEGGGTACYKTHAWWGEMGIVHRTIARGCGVVREGVGISGPSITILLHSLSQLLTACYIDCAGSFGPRNPNEQREDNPHLVIWPPYYCRRQCLSVALQVWLWSITST